MAIIPRTVLATSDPVDICRGFALFPRLGTARAGAEVRSQVNNLVDIERVPLAVIAFSANADLGIRFGLCGPAYGHLIEVEGRHTRERLDLTVLRDQTEAGFFIGLAVSVSFDVGVELINGIEWVDEGGWISRPVASWRTAVELSFSIEFDIIALALSYLVRRLGDASTTGNRIDTVTTTFPGVTGAAFSLRGSEQNTVASSGGTFQVSPSVTVPINLISVLASQFPAVKAFIAPLEKNNVFLAVGPQFTISVPIEFRVAGFRLDTQDYFSNAAWTDTGVTLGRTQGAYNPNPTTITETVWHRLAGSIGLSVGIFVNLTVAEVFNAGGTWVLDLPNLFTFTPRQGYITNTISNTIGRTRVGFDPLESPGLASEEPDEYEVVFA